MRKMFDYLDRFYLKNGSERCENLTQTALTIFKAKVFKSRSVDVRWAILQEI
jgi:hypothetical protein